MISMGIKQQYIAFITIARKETTRILRIWPQTFIPSIITSALYFVVFGHVLGERIGKLGDNSYIDFILPGLVIMNVISNSYNNSVFAIFVEKFHRSLEEIIKSPAKPYVILAGYTTGSMLRSIISGLCILLVASFFTKIKIHNISLMILIILMASLLFSTLGLINGIFAKKWDDVSWILSFVITPLSYLGGIFYSVSSLRPVWQKASLFNPIFYFIDSFRYSMIGVQTLDPWITVSTSVFLIIFFWVTTLLIFKKAIQI